MSSRRPLAWYWVLALYLLAIGLGVGSAVLVLKSKSGFGEAAGPWRASVLAGSREADLYTRARVALGGLLALNRNETMYYLATTDSAGNALRSKCSYRVSGTPPSARWWSITAYAEDFFLFPNEERRYSLNGSGARLDSQGRFTLLTAPTKPPEAASDLWVPTPGDRAMMLTLRLYNPDPSLASAPATLTPPAIEMLGKCE